MVLPSSDLTWRWTLNPRNSGRSLVLASSSGRLLYRNFPLNSSSCFRYGKLALTTTIRTGLRNRAGRIDLESNFEIFSGTIPRSFSVPADGPPPGIMPAIPPGGPPINPDPPGKPVPDGPVGGPIIPPGPVGPPGPPP